VVEYHLKVSNLNEKKKLQRAALIFPLKNIVGGNGNVPTVSKKEVKNLFLISNNIPFQFLPMDQKVLFLFEAFLFAVPSSLKFASLKKILYP